MNSKILGAMVWLVIMTALPQEWVYFRQVGAAPLASSADADYPLTNHFRRRTHTLPDDTDYEHFPFRYTPSTVTLPSMLGLPLSRHSTSFPRDLRIPTSTPPTPTTTLPVSDALGDLGIQIGPSTIFPEFEEAPTKYHTFIDLLCLLGFIIILILCIGKQVCCRV